MSLLGVDVGIRTGLALFSQDGRLVWYRSHNFGSATRLRRGVHGLLAEIRDLSCVVIEGGGPLAEIWKKESVKRGVHLMQIAAERWRERLLYDRHRRSGADAKVHAGELARSIITWSQAPEPTSLRHDAAEAIVIGFWAVLELGLLDNIPRALRR